MVFETGGLSLVLSYFFPDYLGGHQVFVKNSWRNYKGKRYQQFYLAETYRDPETGRPRHRLLVNLTSLPPHVIEAIRQSLKTTRTAEIPPAIQIGDISRGAGLLAIHCAWEKTGIDTCLSECTPEQRKLVHALVGYQILQPPGGPGLDEYLRDTMCGRFCSDQNIKKCAVIQLMECLNRNFSNIQEHLRQRVSRWTDLVVWVYDTAGIGMKGRGAPDEDHAWEGLCDRSPGAVGLVCNRVGIPLFVEVFPGSHCGCDALLERVGALKKFWSITKAVWVGYCTGENGGATSRFLEAGLDYVVAQEPGRWSATATGPFEVAGGKTVAGRVSYVHEPEGQQSACSMDRRGGLRLKTSLPPEDFPPSRLDQMFRLLEKVEKARRSIFGHLKIAPPCSKGEGLCYGPALIFFLTSYLVRVMELEMRKHGEDREAEIVLREWDRLRLVELNLDAGGRLHADWRWSLGPDGRAIADRLKAIGWWTAIDRAASRLLKMSQSVPGCSGNGCNQGEPE